MDPRSPLGRYQRQRLHELQQLGICTDLSLSVALAELGQPCSRSALSRMRSGERAAPLALLDLLLTHCTQDEQIAVLELWAKPLGLAVVRAAPARRVPLYVLQRLVELTDELEALGGQLKKAA